MTVSTAQDLRHAGLGDFRASLSVQHPPASLLGHLTCWCLFSQCSSIFAWRTGSLHSGHWARNSRQCASWRARWADGTLLLLPDAGKEVRLIAGIKHGALFFTQGRWVKECPGLKH